MRAFDEAQVRLDGIASLVLPVVFGLGERGILVYDHFTSSMSSRSCSRACRWSASSRGWRLAFVENVQMLDDAAGTQPVTDVLTGLPNRQRA